MPYTILVTKRVVKEFDKLPSEICKSLLQETHKLSQEPNLGEQLKGQFRAFRSLHVKINNVNYRVVYQVVEAKKLIYIEAVGTRENFYIRLERLRLKAA